VDLLLTELSQVSEAGPGDGGQQRLVPICVLTDKFEGQTPHADAEQCDPVECNLLISAEGSKVC
jgi:hypothetical protein